MAQKVDRAIGWDAEDMREHREMMQAKRERRRNEGTQQIFSLRDEGYNVVEINEYQFRINGYFDVFPTNRKWHDISTNKRGKINGSIRDFVMSKLGPFGDC